jgi:hypothetical protein
MFPLYEILLGYQYTHNLEPLPLWLTGSPLGKLFHSGILSFLSVFFVFTLITTILVEGTYGVDCMEEVLALGTKWQNVSFVWNPWGYQYTLITLNQEVSDKTITSLDPLIGPTTIRARISYF